MTVIEDIIQKTLGTVETIAPKAWQLAVQAQRINAVTSLIECGISIIVIIALSSLLWKNINGMHDGGDKNFIMSVSGILMSLIVLLVSSCIIEASARLMYPEVQAAQELMNRK